MMRFILIAALMTGSAALVASEAAAKDAAVKAGYCKIAATKLAAGCTPVLPTPCYCVPSNEHANGKATSKVDRGAVGKSYAWFEQELR